MVAEASGPVPAPLRCSRPPGDSGSAMYLRPTVAGETWARGIVSGSDPGNELVSGDAITCGTAIGTVLNAYGATLLVK
jgi:hypothetical protein